MSVRFFEDFEVGQIFNAGGIKLSLEQIMEFARNYDPQPFHVDIDYAEKFQYGGPVIKGPDMGYTAHGLSLIHI